MVGCGWCCGGWTQLGVVGGHDRVWLVVWLVDMTGCGWWCGWWTWLDVVDGVIGGHDWVWLVV